jgi:hypothetical protein
MRDTSTSRVHPRMDVGERGIVTMLQSGDVLAQNETSSPIIHHFLESASPDLCTI